MILLHAIKMTLAIEDGEQVQYNEDVTFYAYGTMFDAVRSLAELQRITRELKEERDPTIVYHLLHTSEIVTPWFEEISSDLSTLGGQDLAWQIKQASNALESKKSWYKQVEQYA